MDRPLVFKDDIDPKKTVSIIDIAVSQFSMVAMTDDRKIYVWGRKMGIYPSVELTLDFVEEKGRQYEDVEINQACPRLLKNNLIFYNISKIKASFFNTALITDKGELLLQGYNDSGQLLLPAEIAQHLRFFPSFKKIDYF